jgi:hypothetical protein
MFCTQQLIEQFVTRQGKLKLCTHFKNKSDSLGSDVLVGASTKLQKASIRFVIPYLSACSFRLKELGFQWKGAHKIDILVFLSNMSRRFNSQ